MISARLLALALERRILQAAERAGMSRTVLRTIVKGSPPLIVNKLASRFTFDPARDDFFTTSGEGVDQVIAAMKYDPEFAGFFPDRRGAGTKSDRDVLLTCDEASDKATYRQAEQRAAAQGGRVIVT